LTDFGRAGADLRGISWPEPLLCPPFAAEMAPGCVPRAGDAGPHPKIDFCHKNVV
jgi:hypothetical protein